MGKKKRRGKQKNQNQQPLQGAEPDDPTFEPSSGTLPETNDTANISTSRENEDEVIPSMGDVKDSCLIIRSIEQDGALKEQSSTQENESPSPEIGTPPGNNILSSPELPLEPAAEKSDIKMGSGVELRVESTSETTNDISNAANGEINTSAQDVVSNKYEHSIPLTETKPENKLSEQNVPSAVESTSVTSVINNAGGSETSYLPQAPTEIGKFTSAEGDISGELRQTSSEKEIKCLIISDESNILEDSVVKSIISNTSNTSVLPSNLMMMSMEQEDKKKVEANEEKLTVTPQISMENSNLLTVKCEEEPQHGKCLENPDIPTDTGSMLTDIKIKGNVNQKTNFELKDDCLVPGKEISEVGSHAEDMNLSNQNHTLQKTKDYLSSQVPLPIETDVNTEDNSEQHAASTYTSNEANISSKPDIRKSNKKNKGNNANKHKPKAEKCNQDKISLLPDTQVPLDTKATKLIGIKSDTEQQTNHKITFQPDSDNSGVTKDLGEKKETFQSDVKLIELDQKSSNGDYVTAKDKEVNTDLSCKSITSSPEVIEGNDMNMIADITSLKGNDKKQTSTMTGNHTKSSAKNSDKIQVDDLQSEEISDSCTSQPINSPIPQETVPVTESKSKIEIEKKTEMLSSEVDDTHIQKTNPEDSDHPRLKKKKEVGKKLSDPKNYDLSAKHTPHPQKIDLYSEKLNETVLDSFVDPNLNTMLSRNKKGTSKQRKNAKRKAQTEMRLEENILHEDASGESKIMPDAFLMEESAIETQQKLKSKNNQFEKIDENSAAFDVSNIYIKQTNQTNASSPFISSNQTTVTTEEGEGFSLLHTEERVPARPIFMANTCHVCKLTHGGSTRLKSCSACRLITYCSKEHQKKHWKEHKSICQVARNMIKQRGLTDLFGNAYKITDPEEWRKFRCYLLAEAEKYVGRVLLPYEREMFLYPRTCGKCHKSDPEKLKVCKVCHYVNYCCNEHIPDTHNIWCQDLKLLLEINQYQSVYGLIKPHIPYFRLDESKPFPKDMKDFIFNSLSREKNVNSFNLYEAALSDVASYPLTVLYVLEYLKGKNFNIPSGNKLSIHLVGAESQFEADTLLKWDSFLLNLLPNIVQLYLVFIGPELMPNALSRENGGNYEKMDVKTIDASKKFVTEFHYGKLYHEYVTEKTFTKPDMICAFNCGIYRFTGYDMQDTWGPTMSAMLKYQNTPIILTAYTAVEAPKDVERFQNEFKIKILQHPTRNPFSSMKPNLNFVSDDETPVIYKNQYLSTIVKED